MGKMDPTLSQKRWDLVIFRWQKARWSNAVQCRRTILWRRHIHVLLSRRAPAVCVPLGFFAHALISSTSVHTPRPQSESVADADQPVSRLLIKKLNVEEHSCVK